MKPKTLWQIKACLIVLLLICGALLVASFLLNDKFTWVFAALFIIMLLVTIIRYRFMRRDIYRFLGEVAQTLDADNREILNRFPLPVLLVGTKREVL